MVTRRAPNPKTEVRFLAPVSNLGPVAQLDRALDYESRGLGFESLQAHQKELI